MAICTKLNIIDGAAGSGMLGLAVHVALESIGQSAQTVCYIERESYCAATLVARMDEEALDKAPVWDDWRTFDGKPWRGIVDILTAGYPCQPFSVAGRRLGERDPRHLWPEIHRTIEEMEPGIVFMENVPGHLTMGLDTVARQLEELGYIVTPGLFSAAEVCANHQRTRLFILAYRAGGGCDRHKKLHSADNQSEAKPGRHAERCNQDVANDTSKRLQGGWDNNPSKRRQKSNRPTSVCSSLPLHAPGMDDGRWGEIIERYPSLKPAIYRVADGVATTMANRCDALRQTGNGVVAATAAAAFIQLLACSDSRGEA